MPINITDKRTVNDGVKLINSVLTEFERLSKFYEKQTGENYTKNKNNLYISSALSDFSQSVKQSTKTLFMSLDIPTER